MLLAIFLWRSPELALEHAVEVGNVRDAGLVADLGNGRFSGGFGRFGLMSLAEKAEKM